MSNGAIYNEIEPYACEWIRNLGAIADAENDELEVAWDAIHRAGWQLDHVEIRRHDDPRSGGWLRSTILVLKDHRCDLPIFLVVTWFDSATLTIHVTPTWLGKIPEFGSISERDMPGLAL